MTAQTDAGDRDEQPGGELWRDVAMSAADRARDLAARMTLEEKLAQLVGLWVGADATGGGVAPHQADLAGTSLDWATVIRHGLGQLTRPFGSVPVEPALGARGLAASQREIVAASRFGIPALVHEECLTGFAAWKATVYPVPLCWGASFDPALVEEMSARIGASMQSVGVHQGLAPVLDVTRDYRWGRTEETISEDPYLVSTVGAAYVRGLESTGLIATLKHFAGYSASAAGRNLAPVHAGPRELADVILPPFEAGLRLGGARSVMHSYSEIDGVPVAADPAILTELLRDTWGFDGTVVADYFAIRFLETLHHVADGPASAAHLALRAGIDVELPTVDTFGAPLRDAVRAGDVPVELVDRALERVLRQKIEIGLLEPDWDPEPSGGNDVRLDDAGSRAVALRLAHESLVLLANDSGLLPLAARTRLAVVGPLADEPMAMMGCYAFPAHVGVHHPDRGLGLDVPTVLDALRADHDVLHARGCDVTDPDRSGFEAARAAARQADVCVVVVGDRSGLFGRGTSGEGCDAADLALPGVQADLVRAVQETGTPVVLLLMTGRPYAVGELADASGAVVQAFFPGQQGAPAIADVLSGRVAPSGRLPVSMPRSAGAQPGTYLAPALGRRTSVSSVDPTPLFPFGHGLGYERADWEGVEVLGDDRWAVDGEVRVRLTVRHRGERAAADVVQLYLHDPVSQVTQPVVRLIGYARVELQPGEARQVTFTVPADMASFTGTRGCRVVEPGAVELRVARSSADVVEVLHLQMVGEEREVGPDRRLVCEVTVDVAGAGAASGRDYEEVAV